MDNRLGDIERQLTQTLEMVWRIENRGGLVYTEVSILFIKVLLNI